MNRFSRLCLVSIFVMLATACATTQEDSASDATDGATAGTATTDQGSRSSGAETMGAPDGGGFEGSPLDDPSSLLSKRVIYFDFDRAQIKSEYREIIIAHANYLTANPNTDIVLEGHTDERGSREYNMGLGERRNNSVSQILILQGVSSGQIDSVSYGEERPVAMGHDEESWRLNRRVEIIYR